MPLETSSLWEPRSSGETSCLQGLVFKTSETQNPKPTQVLFPKQNSFFQNQVLKTGSGFFQNENGPCDYENRKTKSMETIDAIVFLEEINGINGFH